MSVVTGTRPDWRATWTLILVRAVAAAGGAAARLRAARHSLISLALVVAGGLGAMAGGWLIGRWCLGLVIISESVGLVLLGLNRDDGQPAPVRGARSVAQVLDDERIRP